MNKPNRIVTKARLFLALLILASFVLIPTHAVFAASVGTAGQPNQSCEDVGVRPGHAMTAPGSAFNPDGVSGAVYAGEQPQNSNNPKSVSQYDVACFQVAQH